MKVKNTDKIRDLLKESRLTKKKLVRLSHLSESQVTTALRGIREEIFAEKIGKDLRYSIIGFRPESANVKLNKFQQKIIRRLFNQKNVTTALKRDFHELLNFVRESNEEIYTQILSNWNYNLTQHMIYQLGLRGYDAFHAGEVILESKDKLDPDEYDEYTEFVRDDGYFDVHGWQEKYYFEFWREVMKEYLSLARDEICEGMEY